MIPRQDGNQVGFSSEALTVKKSIKKVIILDAGGVLQPDAEFDLPNQVALAELTKLTHDELSKLNQYYQDPDVLIGKRSFRDVIEIVAKNTKVEHQLSVDELLQAYKKGVALYPGVPDMIRELYRAGYQVVICTTNSDVGVAHTKWLLAEEGLHCPVYGSAELHLLKNNPAIYSKICEAEKVNPDECWFIDDRQANLAAAQSLGIGTIKFNQPVELHDAAKEVNACRDQFLAFGILNPSDFVFPPQVNRGKYPSLFGVIDNSVIRYQPSQRSYIKIDETNEDGNQKKRCLYESRLSQLVVEQGRQYWSSAYDEINQLFLADFDLKSDPERVQAYKVYFDKIGSVLKKEGLIEDKQSYDIEDLRSALVKLFFNNDFNLTNVSQFYYNVWLFNYGPEPLEPFIFLTDLLKENDSFLNDSSQQDISIRILKLFPDMAHSVDDRRQAYYLAQPWLTCGVPQLRGRQTRANAPKPAEAKTLGIIRDDDSCAADFSSPPHFAAKTFFSPLRVHPIAKEFEPNAAPIIGGSSGTLGRNVLMLAPLVQSGLLSQAQLMNYVMGFSADLVYRGHHSYEEIAVVADQVLFPLKPWFDSLRDPIRFYEQLLTDKFLASDIYRKFSVADKNFFNVPVAQMKLSVSKKDGNVKETKPDVRATEKLLQHSSWSWSKKALFAGVSFGALFVGYSLFSRGMGVSSGSGPRTILRPKL